MCWRGVGRVEKGNRKRSWPGSSKCTSSCLISFLLGQILMTKIALLQLNSPFSTFPSYALHNGEIHFLGALPSGLIVTLSNSCHWWRREEEEGRSWGISPPFSSLLPGVSGSTYIFTMSQDPKKPCSQLSSGHPVKPSTKPSFQSLARFCYVSAVAPL